MWKLLKETCAVANIITVRFFRKENIYTKHILMKIKKANLLKISLFMLSLLDLNHPDIYRDMFNSHDWRAV